MKDTERTFFFSALVVLLLLGLHFLPDITIDGTELRRVSILSDLFPDSSRTAQPVIPPSEPVTMAQTRHGKIKFKEEWPEGTEPIIDYSADGTNMDIFYEALSKVKTMDRPVRIAWFSDSFIEDDIVTADIREFFQKDFGGCGVGWIDLANPANKGSRRTVTQQTAGATEYTVAGKPFDNNRTGINERYYTVAAGARVTTSVSSVFNRRQPHSKHFEVTRLFFRAPSGAVITASVNGGKAVACNAAPSPEVQMMAMNTAGNTITYTFQKPGRGFTPFGMALESRRGVIVDCMSMRGSNGLPMRRIPQQTIAGFTRLRPYDLVIFQFGLNTATTGNSKWIKTMYIPGIKKTVSYLHKAFAGSAFLVMSVSDRAQRSADGITTIPEVYDLVACQQQVAADCHVAWLNFFKAMGGTGSITGLVDRRMANKDYTHLSYGGGHWVAAKVYPSFKAGYRNYLRRKKLEEN